MRKRELTLRTFYMYHPPIHNNEQLFFLASILFRYFPDKGQINLSAAPGQISKLQLTPVACFGIIFIKKQNCLFVKIMHYIF